MRDAVRLLAGQWTQTPAKVIDLADAIAQWLDPLVLITVTVSPVRRQNDPHTLRAVGGTPMQIHDDEQFDVTLTAKDAKGYDVAGESFTATADDESVAAVTQDGATFTVVAGNPGSTVLTFTDGTVSATLAVDVVPGDVATIEVTPGAPSKQAA